MARAGQARWESLLTNVRPFPPQTGHCHHAEPHSFDRSRLHLLLPPQLYPRRCCSSQRHLGLHQACRRRTRLDHPASLRSLRWARNRRARDHFAGHRNPRMQRSRRRISTVGGQEGQRTGFSGDYVDAVQDCHAQGQAGKEWKRESKLVAEIGCELGEALKKDVDVLFF